MSKISKSIEAESELVVAEGWRRWDWRVNSRGEEILIQGLFLRWWKYFKLAYFYKYFQMIEVYILYKCIYGMWIICQ